MNDLIKVYPMFDVDERVKVIVLTGAGKTFCAGADLDIGFQGGKERVMDHRDGGGRVVLAIHKCRKPTIVAMQGSAVGVGMTMALPAAIRQGFLSIPIINTFLFQILLPLFWENIDSC